MHTTLQPNCKACPAETQTENELFILFGQHLDSFFATISLERAVLNYRDSTVFEYQKELCKDFS